MSLAAGMIAPIATSTPVSSTAMPELTVTVNAHPLSPVDP
jgi:hypothetical protein